MTFFQSRTRSARRLARALLVPAAVFSSGASSIERPVKKAGRKPPVIRPVKVDYPWGVGLFILEDPESALSRDGSLIPRVVIIDATRKKGLSEFPFQFDELDKVAKVAGENQTVMGEDSAEGAAAIVGGPRLALRTDTDIPRRADETVRRTPQELEEIRKKKLEEETRDAREAAEAAELARAEKAEREKAERERQARAVPEEEALAEMPAGSGDAPQDVMRPVSTFDAIKVRRQLEGVMRKVMKPSVGGSIRVLADEILEGPAEDGRRMFYLGNATAQFQKCTVKDVPVRAGMLLMRNLALDAAALDRSELVVLSSPSVMPSLTVDHSVLVHLMQKERVKDVEVRFENDTITLRGRFPYGIFSIPFHLDGRLMMVQNNLAFKIVNLRIRGEPADADQVAKLQRKCDRLLPLESALSVLKASSLSIAGGQVAVIGEGGQPLYQARFSGP